MKEMGSARTGGLCMGSPPPDPAAGIDSFDVFTTRPDTIFGASFVAVAADHPIAQAVAASDPDAARFVAECKAGGTRAAEAETDAKNGFKTKVEVAHRPAPERRLPA